MSPKLGFASAVATTVSVTAALGDGVFLHAQTAPARPAVSVRQLTRLFYAIRIADFNEDGKPDLIGSTAAMDLQIAIGRGDGTFDSPRSLGVNALPYAIGDFNADGHLDVVTTAVAILPGRGDGTFGAARVVDTSVGLPLGDDLKPGGIAADFNGDGKLDLVLTNFSVVGIYPGRGDFTFGARVELPASPDYDNAIVAADFNGDGRLDIAATTFGQPIDVFLNQGALLFSAASIPVGFSLWDVAAGDLNQDGKADLVVASSAWESSGYSAGVFHVLLGNGNGTFQTPVSHATSVHGALTIALGDFNRDGHIDVATGNRSTRLIDTPCTGFVYWDSVTIAPGVGNGTFGAPASFRLGSQNIGDELFQNRHNSIAAADLNGDGSTDLVTSPGAIVLSRPATANRAPLVSAGPDQAIVPGEGFTRFDAFAFDPDFDWLEFEWRDAAGNIIGPHFDDLRGLPMFCQDVEASTYTLTVTDRRGGAAADSMTIFPAPLEDVALAIDRPPLDETLGTQSPYTIRWFSRNLAGLASFRLSSSGDNGKTWTPIPGCESLPASATSCVWTAPDPVTDAGRVLIEAFNSSGSRIAFDPSDRFRIIAGVSTALRYGWWQADVGPVGAPGTAIDDGTTITVAGSGTDIWGTRDEFHWVFTIMSGDFDVIARVNSVQNVNRWTKAGVMLREQISPGARHASLFVTPTVEKGLAFQARLTTNGTSVSTAGPAITAPVWIRLARAGNQVRAYYRVSTTDAWHVIGTQTFTALADSLQVGLAVTSHVHDTLAKAAFDGIQVMAPVQLPAGWSEEDIGAVGAAGAATGTMTTFTVTGAGADIWGSGDAFHWAYRPASGNFSIETQVDSVQNVNRWTKAGIMIRAAHAPGAQHASLFATPTTEKGLSFQGRPSANGQSIEISNPRPLAAPPVWLRLTRRGGTIDAYYRKTKTDAWRNLGSMVLTGLPDTVLIGLAVTSHVSGTLATAQFTQIAIEPVLAWTTARIGAGESNSYVNGTFFSVQNRGADIWGTSDAFTFVHTKWSGDGALTARLNHLDFTSPWVKGGVMFRESLAANSAYAFGFASGEKGTWLQYRAASGVAATSAGSVPVNAPGEFSHGFWLQIIREGNTFKSYISMDAFQWNQIGQVTLAMGADIYVGLAVTSHNTSALAWGMFDDVTLRRSPFSPTPTPMGQ
jgi:regulation of enolase protein 1 (concanavalin A-like superfamily)